MSVVLQKLYSVLSFSSIRAKLVWILAVMGGLPILATGFLFYNSAANALLYQTQQQLGNLAEKTAQQIDTFFQVSRKEITLLSNFPFVQLAFLQFEFSQRLDTVKKHLEDYSTRNNYISNIYLINLEGKPILSLNRTLPENSDSFLDQHWFKQTLAEGMYLSELDMDGQEITDGLILAKTVHDFENADRIVGILAFDIKRSSFTRFAASVKIGARGFSFLINKRKVILYHPNLSVEIKNTSNLGDDRLKILNQNMAEGKSGYGNYAFQGDEKYLVYRPCKERPWSVGVTVFKSELMADIHSFRERLISFFAILIVLIVPVSYFFIKSITTPIQSLIKGAASIGSGDLNHLITIKSNDELQEVASEFNKMAGTLRDSMEEILEIKIFYEDILRNATNGIITVDRMGNITSLNKGARHILQFTPSSEFIAWSEALPKPVRQIMTLLKETLESGNGVSDYELTIAHPHQEDINLEINTSLLSNQLGKTFGAIADVRDITKRKRMEEIMVRVDKLASLGELSAGVAHEIRNPLAGIKTSVQVLAKRVHEADEKELIDGILIEINRLNTIVTDLLMFSRPSQPQIVPVHITSALDTSLKLVAQRIKRSGIQLYKEYDENLVPVLADKEQIKQILLNLLLNSIKAMQYGGELKVKAKLVTDVAYLKNQWSRFNNPNLDTNSDFVELAIEDSGIGIEKENLAKIFNPFFTTDPRGTGLGLPIVHQLLEQNNGYIIVDSRQEVGTQIRLLLPIEQQQTGRTL